MSYLNIWHYVVLAVIFLIFLGGIYASLQQKEPKMRLGMIFSVTLISLFLGVLSIFVIDKYTKKVELFKVKNKRLLSIEKIIYTGFVKNTGKYPVGKVTMTIKLVNRGHATGNVKGGNFYKPSGFMSFFSEGLNMRSKPQTIEKEFVIARNLKPGQSKQFRVYFKYPGYFTSTAEFIKVSGH